MTSHGLRGRLTRLLHWELNVRDLARSVAFYEALTPLRATPAIDDGRTRSVLLVGDAAPLPRLRLVEWREPPTTGVAHGRSAAHLSAPGTSLPFLMCAGT